MSALHCEYQPACPGCPRLGEDHLDPERVSQLEQVRSAFGVGAPPLETVPFDGRGARHRVRLSVRGRAGSLGVGIFEQGTHRLVSIPRCLVHHPSIQRFLPLMLDMLNRFLVVPYDEPNHQGELKAVQLATVRTSGKLQVVFLVRHDKPEPSTELSAAIEALNDDSLVHSVFVGHLPHRTNSLFSESFRGLHGESAFEDPCAGATNVYPPGAFGQANPVQHERVVERILSAIPAGTSCFEYYAGVGTIGLALVARGESVRFNEVGAGSVEGLRQGWARIRGDAPVPLQVGKAGAFAQSYRPEEVVIVDPPRKGLDAALLERLLAEPPKKLVYLSCGLDALVKEAKLFAKSGGYHLRGLSAWAYFPFTSHVETLMVLDRK